MPTFTGTTGNDNFVGTDFDDTFTLFAGSDTASGLAGDDTFIVKSGLSYTPTIADFIYGGDGDDAIEVQTTYVIDAPNYNTTNTTLLTIDGGAGTNSVYLNPGVYPENTLSLTNVQVLALIGDSQLSVETIDSVGELTVWDGTNLTPLATGTLSVSLTDGGAIDLTNSVAFNAFIYASKYGNEVTAGSEATTFYGGGGNDAFHGGAGNDVVYGDSGTNLYDGGGGSNTVNYSNATLGVTVSLLTTGYQSTGYSDDQLINIQEVIGSSRGGENNLTANADGSTLEVSGQYGFGVEYTPVKVGTATLYYAYAYAGDTLTGGTGNDTLVASYHQPDGDYGGDVNGDILYGGSGDDTINLGPSGQYYETGQYFARTEFEGAPAYIYGGDGNDVITVQSQSVIDGGAGNDLINVVSSQPTSAPLPEADAHIEITGGAGADTFVISNSGSPVYITDFTAGQDYLNLSNDYTATSNGNDHLTITQQGPNTIITGGYSPITLLDVQASSIPKSAFIDPGAANTSGKGYVDFNVQVADTVTISGTAGNDVLSANPSGSSIDGGTGDDTLIGGAGPDHLYGGLGDDVIMPGLNSDYLDGGLGSNTVDFSNAGSAVSANLLTQAATLSGGETDQLFNFQTVIGSPFNDVLTADNAGVTLEGGVGNDILVGGAGADLLIGGPGEDLLTGGAGADTFLFHSGDSIADAIDSIADFQTGEDQIEFSGFTPTSISIVRAGSGSAIFAVDPSGAETVIGVTGVVQAGDISIDGVHPAVSLVGGSANDDLVGGISGDQLFGGAGNDILTGGGGADALTGGAGSDTFVYQAASDSSQSAPDFITDFQIGQDKIDLTAVPVTHISTIDDGGATFVFVETSQGEMQINVEGTAEAGDILTTGVVNFYEIGDGDNNALVGGAGNDVLQGGSGNETLIGGGSSDALFGGEGADTFKYLSDTESSLSAPDTIFDFQTGVDKIDLTAVNPTHVSVLVDGPADFLFISVPGAAMEIGVVGSIQASDVITGSATTPFYIVGDNNAHTLIGGGGPDVIAGGAGNDVIIGGGGTDALYGDAGSDTFKYLAASDSTTSAPDTIFDFQTGIDKIDLSAIHTSSKDAFNILVSGNASYLYIDQGGDGINDMLIQIANPNLHATDIVW